MNVKQVKERWTLESLLKHLGYEPDVRKSRGHDDLWYRSPFRPDEKEASFHIHAGQGIWKDFGLTGKSGGDLIYFAQKYLEEQGKPYRVSDALKWFSALSGDPVPAIPAKPSGQAVTGKTKAFELLSAKPVFSQALFNYLKERGITRETGLRYLKQVYFFHAESGRKIYGLGFANRTGGYDVRNPLGFKGVIGSKDVSFITGSQVSDTAEVFEGFFDFLSYVERYAGAGALAHDCIVLNSNSLYAMAAGLIHEKGYRRVRLWLDNDKGGETGRVAIQEAVEQLNPGRVTFETMHHQYAGYKDLNAWHQAGKKSGRDPFVFSFQ